MAAPWERTLAVLRHSEDAQATSLVLAALAVPIDEYRVIVAEVIAQRLVPREMIELLRQFPTLPDQVGAVIQRYGPNLSGAFRQLVLHGTPAEQTQLLATIRDTDSFDQLPLLIELLQREPFPQEGVLETYRVLIDRLVEVLDGNIHRHLSDQTLTVASRSRTAVVTQLEQLVVDVSELPTAAGDFIEALLIVGTMSTPAVRKLLWNSPPAVRQLAISQLLTGTHPAMARRLLESLSQSYPHPRMFDILGQRRDVEFVCHFLRQLPARLSGPLLENLQQIDRIDWLQQDLSLLDLLPPDLQPVLIEFVVVTGLPRETKVAVHDWMLHFGSANGKIAAAEHAGLLDEGVMQDVLRDSLDSEDEDVQVWAVSQLRAHAIPDSFRVLVERLDSPIAAVRTAARAELADFDTDRVCSLAMSLDAETGRCVGELLLKIDDHAVSKLQRELAHPMRQRRLQTLQRLTRLDLQDVLIDAILALIDDPDPTIRRTVAETLSRSLEPRAAIGLERLLGDEQPRVRESAARALANFHQRLQDLLEASRQGDAGKPLSMEIF